MRYICLPVAALLMVGAVWAGAAWAHDIQREEIRRVDVPGSDAAEVVVFRLTVPVGATISRHTHPGDEHVVVVTDARAEAPNGNVVEFTAGTPLYFPEGQAHGGLTNVGDAPMVAITTLVVRKGEPLIVPAN